MLTVLFQRKVLCWKAYENCEVRGTCGLEQVERLKKLKPSGIRRFFTLAKEFQCYRFKLRRTWFHRPLINGVFSEFKEALAEECKCIVIRVTVLLAGGVPISLLEKTAFKPTASGVMSLITDKSRVIVLNHPNNLQEPFFFVMRLLCWRNLLLGVIWLWSWWDLWEGNLWWCFGFL